jgi:hypothetical protein
MGLLSAHEPAYVTVEQAVEPQQHSPSGKYRTVVPLSE